jgi:hypothetical protein
MSIAAKLRSEINVIEDQLQSKKAQLEREERECRHNSDQSCWMTTPDDVCKPGYTIPGDPPGTMGIDRRFDVHVPAKTTKRWKRVCKLCGKIEHTTNVTQRTVDSPSF